MGSRHAVSAGGIIRAVSFEQDGEPEHVAAVRVDGVGATVRAVLRDAPPLASRPTTRPWPVPKPS